MQFPKASRFQILAEILSVCNNFDNGKSSILLPLCLCYFLRQQFNRKRHEDLAIRWKLSPKFQTTNTEPQMLVRKLVEKKIVAIFILLFSFSRRIMSASPSNDIKIADRTVDYIFYLLMVYCQFRSFAWEAYTVYSPWSIVFILWHFLDTFRICSTFIDSVECRKFHYVHFFLLLQILKSLSRRSFSFLYCISH